MGRLDGRAVVVTGATAGIGRATAVGLARLGASLVLIGRDAGRADETVTAVRAAAPAAEVRVLLGDLGSLAEVRRLADAILARHRSLHVLVNNAAVTLTKRRLSPDGFELTFAVNHLAPFLLTGLLLPSLRAGAPARIVTVASDAHRFGRIDPDDLQSERRYGALRVYGRSKTANILFTRELARRLAERGIPGVTANCLHPGAIRSRLGRGNGPLLDGVQRLVGLFLRPPEEGARTSIHLASAAGLEGTSGGYWVRCRRVEPAAHARDDALAARLWRESEALTGVGYP